MAIVGLVIGSPPTAEALRSGLTSNPAAVLPGAQTGDGRHGTTCRFRAGSHRLSIKAPASLVHIEPPEFPGFGELPPLPPLVVPGEAIVSRDDDELVIRGDAKGRLDCRGGVPTVLNTDLIRVRTGRHGEGTRLRLDLRAGPLAPGATDESDDAAEIEVEADLGGGGLLEVWYADRSDALSAGRMGRHAGVNLNASGVDADVDVMVGFNDLLSLEAGDGGGLFSAAGGPSFTGAWTAPTALIGGHGGDLLVGGDGNDEIAGGPGPDRMLGLGGHDLLFARRGGADFLDCGSSTDIALAADPEDDVRRCEHRVQHLDRAHGPFALLSPTRRSPP